MSDVDFLAMTQKSAKEVEERGAFPSGTFRATISGVQRLQSSKKKTECIAFSCRPYEAIDADETELEEFGDWQNYEFKGRATVSPLTFFIVSEATLARLAGWNKKRGVWVGFLPEVAGVPEASLESKSIWVQDADGVPGDCACVDAIGSDIIITVGHDVSDAGREYATITDVAPNV